MSGNGKIMCNHGVNLFKCQTCIDALVAEQIEKQEQRITDLEQQLKAARKEAFIAGANEYHLGPEVLVYAENYAKQFEQG
jgi:predicted metal-binding protein